MKAICELELVSKSYPSPGERGTIEVLKKIDLVVSPGESVAIVGPSGSGKSTLLNLIGCLDDPSSGTIRLGGTDLGKMAKGELSRFRGSFLGFVFQLHHLLPQCTVLENVLVPTLPRRSDRDAAERAVRLIERVGLSARLHHRPAELSGGEALRAAIARALINRPALLLADEPTGSLDQSTSDLVADLLFDLNSTEGVSIIAVTHSQRLASRADTVYTLDRGMLYT